MIFNSAAFVVFLVFAFAVYWMFSRKTSRIQNIVLISLGCLFYGSWDWKFLGLLIISGTADYFIARQLGNNDSRKNKNGWMILSLLLNIGTLFYFKYFGFFAEAFSALIDPLGMHAGYVAANLILPLGISYYTFLKFGYILDVWRGQQKAERDPANYFAFLLFFPYTLAGPVERARNMFPQFSVHRVFDREASVVALRIILWGYFKKVVIADRLGEIVNPVFNHSGSYSGGALVIALVLFHIQLYADFSGYSDIARGVAQLFGIKIMNNFDRPFYTSSLRKYWRRWHISVSSWFNEYLFTPLAIQTRNWGNAGIYFSILITFLAIGLWHGAQWTYILWGLFMGILICGEQALHKKIKLPLVASVILVNLLIIYCLILFRSGSIDEANRINTTIFTWSEGAGIAEVLNDVFTSTRFLFVFLVALMVFILGDAYSDKIILRFSSGPKYVRWIGYYALVLLIVFLGVSMNAPAFVYFKF